MPTRKSSRAAGGSAVHFAPAAAENGRGPYRAIRDLFRKVVSKDTITKGD